MQRRVDWEIGLQILLPALLRVRQRSLQSSQNPSLRSGTEMERKNHAPSFYRGRTLGQPTLLQASLRRMGLCKTHPEPDLYSDFNIGEALPPAIQGA